jgi:hypothetical protein
MQLKDLLNCKWNWISVLIKWYRDNKKRIREVEIDEICVGIHFCMAY